MRRTISIPDELAARVDEYLENQRQASDESAFSELVRELLEREVNPSPSNAGRGILRLAGLVSVEPFETEEKATRFANHPEDQFFDRAR